MISCDKARELANAYIDGALDEECSCAYEEHISCCEACHEEYDMLKRISSDLSLTTVPVPDGFARRMHTALVNEQFKKQNKDKKIFAFPYYKAASVMAAALVIAVVGKYGIYDTYKNVTEDTARVALEMSGKVAEELIDVPEVEPIEEKEVENKKIEPVYTTKMAVPETKEPEQISPPVEEEVVISDTAEPDIAVYTEEIAPLQEVDVPATEEQPPLTDSSAMFRMAEPTSTTEVTEESVEDVVPTDDFAESSGGGSPKIVAELIPAEIIIHNNGDASMMMFKKFLLTILDSSVIADNGSEIVVTVTADEYESVMQHLRANEYVKSVTEGTPFDGKAVINIK